MRRPPTPVRSSFRRVLRAATVLALVAGTVAACGSDGPEKTLAAFLTGLQTGSLDKVGFVTPAGAAISAATVLDELQALSGDLDKAPRTATTQGKPHESGTIATGQVQLDWTLPGGAHWVYPSAVRLAKHDQGWQVIWEPEIINSQLTSGDKLRLRRATSDRAGILDHAGAPLFAARPVVTVGVEPDKVTDPGHLTTALTAAFAQVGVTIEPAAVAARVKGAAPGAFVEVVTLRQTDYDKIRDKVQPLAGTVFRTETRQLAPSHTFARALLGTVDAATKDDIDHHPDLIGQGDLVGHGGLQGRYDAQLRGTVGQSVVIARTAPDNTVSDTELFRTPPVGGKPVTVTLDSAIQTAADAATATQKLPSALVAIRISTAEVIAVSNGPDGGGVNTAFTGAVPPGSTFKVISAYGLLAKGAVTADSVASCPKTRVVNGRTFANAAGEVLGNAPFHTDFAKSCNTAFIGLAPKLGADGLHSAASTLGLGGQWDLGADASTGKVSAADTPTELAAASFGQGATVVSPLVMAGVAATVARGRFVQPKLVTDPAPSAPAADGPALPTEAITPLREMMREVVTKGTGTALRGIPGEPVFGKTGTAEFATDSKDTHAWFIGWQGDIAFAVLVQKGGAGADTAVPIVGTFLRTLAKK